MLWSADSVCIVADVLPDAVVSEDPVAVPGQLDALLFGITEEAVGSSALDPLWTANIAGNWYFISVMTLLFLPIIWYVTDKIIEPRLGPWKGGATAGLDASDTSPDPAAHDGALAAKGLRHGGLAALGVIALWVLMTVGPGTPLIDEAACEGVTDCSIHTQLAPLYRSLVAGFFLLFLLPGGGESLLFFLLGDLRRGERSLLFFLLLLLCFS